MGRFIVLEGLDGAGKSTLARQLEAHYDGRLPLLATYEPHNAHAAGDYIRRVLAREIAIAPRTLALAYALNRADHTERHIMPFLAAYPDGLALCDRYLLSSLAYNTSAELPIEAVYALNAAARRPDLTLFLDARPEVCYARLGARGGERELFDEKLEARRLRYQDGISFLRGHGWRIVTLDANGPPDAVLAAALAVIGGQPA